MLEKYESFISSHGRPARDLNPGSKEWALTYPDALSAVSILREINTPILGGDILTMHNGSLAYAYQIWGAEYHTLNWSCEKKQDETTDAYIARSCDIANDAIKAAYDDSQKLGRDLFVVLVVAS